MYGTIKNFTIDLFCTFIIVQASSATDDLHSLFRKQRSSVLTNYIICINRVF